MASRVSVRDGADAPYWNGLDAGKLMLPRCRGCGAWRWPAGHRCPDCGTTGMDWVEQPMAATIFSWTRTWHGFGGAESLDRPFVSIIAKLDESGIRLMGRMDDPDRVDPVIGDAVTGRMGTTHAAGRAIPTIIWSRTA